MKPPMHAGTSIECELAAPTYNLMEGRDNAMHLSLGMMKVD